MPAEITQVDIGNFAYRFWESRIFLTAVELDIFSAIGDLQKTSQLVAEELELDVRATDILLHALAAMGFLQVRKDAFSNTETSSRYLVKGKPDYMGTGLKHSANLWHRWSTLTQVMKTGQPVDMVMPGEVENWTESFIMAMHGRALTRAPKVVDALDLNGVYRLLDLGGGPGTHSIVFAQRKPDLKAVIFDLPDVVPIAGRIVSEAGLSDRVSTMTGDYLTDEYGHGYDMVFMSVIIHSNSPEENTQIFRKAYESLNPGGRIAIVDFVLNENKTEPLFGAIFAVNMLVGTSSGNSYSAGEISSWLQSVGFIDVSSPVEVDEDISLMTAVKSGV